MLLHKYRVVDEYSIRSLRDKNVWFAKPSSFNDPFDLNIPFSDDLPTPDTLLKQGLHVMNHYNEMTAEERIQRMVEGAIELGNLDERELAEQLEEVKQNFRDIRDSWGVLCLSACFESVDDVLMWAHYGDSHKGFIQTFDFDKASDENKEALVKVDYRNELKPVNVNVDFLMQSPYTVKSTAWEYEDEYRMLCEEGGSTQEFPAPLVRITFGLRTSEENKRILREAAGDEVEYFETYVPDTELKLHYRKV